MARTLAGPKFYIHQNPQPNTPQFGGEYIDMRRLSEEEDLDYSYLSKVFNGSRPPGTRYAQRLGDALGMTRAEVYAAYDAIPNRVE